MSARHNAQQWLVCRLGPGVRRRARPCAGVWLACLPSFSCRGAPLQAREHWTGGTARSLSVLAAAVQTDRLAASDALFCALCRRWPQLACRRAGALTRLARRTGIAHSSAGSADAAPVEPAPRQNQPGPCPLPSLRADIRPTAATTSLVLRSPAPLSPGHGPVWPAAGPRREFGRTRSAGLSELSAAVALRHCHLSVGAGAGLGHGPGGRGTA